MYEASTGERLESMELFRARWLFQLGVVYHGWKAYGTEPWFSWAQVEDLLTRSLGVVTGPPDRTLGAIQQPTVPHSPSLPTAMVESGS